jgi:hypothetical protein
MLLHYPKKSWKNFEWTIESHLRKSIIVFNGGDTREWRYGGKVIGGGYKSWSEEEYSNLVWQTNEIIEFVGFPGS